MPKLKEKKRSDFEHVETHILHSPIPDDRVLRPRVNRIDDLNRLADEIKTTPTAIVNFFIDVGLECFERTLPILKEDIKKTAIKKLDKFLK